MSRVPSLAPDRGLGLESLAEDGNPTALAAALSGQPGVVSVGADAIPVGDAKPGPITPGKAYQFGTEVNEEPGLGPNQAPRQSAPNTGPSEHEPVAQVRDRFTYPPTAQVIRVTITAAGAERMM